MTDSLGIEGEEFDVLSPEIDHKYETINSIAVSTSYLKPNNNVSQSFHCTFLLHHDNLLSAASDALANLLSAASDALANPLSLAASDVLGPHSLSSPSRE